MYIKDRQGILNPIKLQVPAEEVKVTDTSHIWLLVCSHPTYYHALRCLGFPLPNAHLVPWEGPFNSVLKLARPYYPANNREYNHTTYMRLKRECWSSTGYYERGRLTPQWFRRFLLARNVIRVIRWKHGEKEEIGVNNFPDSLQGHCLWGTFGRWRGYQGIYEEDWCLPTVWISGGTWGSWRSTEQPWKLPLPLLFRPAGLQPYNSRDTMRGSLVCLVAAAAMAAARPAAPRSKPTYFFTLWVALCAEWTRPTQANRGVMY